jgi:hypothetical protein
VATGDTWHNLAGDDFVSEFTTAPLADRASAFGRRLTGQRDDLADLFRGNAGGLTGTWGIGQAVFERQIRQRDRLESEPAGAPGTDSIDLHIQETGDLGIVKAGIGSKNDASAQGELLRGGMPTDQVVQRQAFAASKGQLRIAITPSTGTGELRRHLAQEWGANLLVRGTEDGGGVVAQRSAVMVETR